MICAAAALVAAAFLACAAAPLWVYALGLACCGLPHVVSELRYVDARFSARLSRPLLGSWVAALAVVVAGRLGALVGLWPQAARPELLLVAGLAASALLVPSASARWRGACLLALGLLGLGIAWDPLATFVILALLHNLTPLGFLAERLEGARRRRALACAAALFFGLPLLLASGLVPVLWGPALWGPALWGPALSGPTSAPFGLELSGQLRVFLLPAWQAAPWAERLFAAAVFTQCMHYLYVILLLPALDREGAWHGAPTLEGSGRATLAPWPGISGTALLLVALGLASLLLFALLGFERARSWYGLSAAVHAWIELPLLLAVPALLRAPRPEPALTT